MKRVIIIGLIAVVVIGGGIASYVSSALPVELQQVTVEWTWFLEEMLLRGLGLERLGIWERTDFVEFVERHSGVRLNR